MKFPCALALAAASLAAGGFRQSADPAPATPQKPAPVQDETEIRKVLSDQAAAWNRGDIPGFMDGYVRSPQLRFASGGSVRYGWEATLRSYQAGYPDAAAMGKLRFSELKVLVLPGGWAEVFGRWKLTRGGKYSDVGGLFTLLMKRTDHGWRVLHDHTSAQPPTSAPATLPAQGSSK